MPNYVFLSSSQTKMDDDYPHLMFGEKVCSFLLNESFSNNNNIKKASTKWLIFSIIGNSLDMILNGNEFIKKENTFKAISLGFFLMYHVYKQTVSYANHTRLFTICYERIFEHIYMFFS